MRVQIQSNKTKTTKYRTIKLKVGKFIVTESYTDDILTGQNWSIRHGFKHTHPSAYEPKSMYFQYYDDISFLKSENCCNYENFYDEIPESSWITCWSKFKGYNHILCIHLVRDGCIYRIDKSNPLPLWRHQDYIGGFCNNHYDLKKIVPKLKRRTWIRNIKTVEIPYYNQYDKHTHAVEFDYKLPSKKHLKIKLEKDFSDHYFG